MFAKYLKMYQCLNLYVLVSYMHDFNMFNIRTDIHAANKNKVAIFLTESQPLAS